MFLLFSGLCLAALVTGDTGCRTGQDCVPAKSCSDFAREKEILNQLPKGSPGYASQLNKLKSLVCNKAERKVCCDGTDSNKDCDDTDEDSPCYRPSLEEERCGLEGDHAGFIVGGEDTRIGQFPFVALLGKNSKRRRGSIFWHCGGTLINKWYVLTAAHCGPKVEYVRLGEWKVVDPDSFTNTTDFRSDGPGTCYVYNDVSKKKCERSRRRCDYCENLDPSKDCDKSKDGVYNLCSEPVQDIPVAEVKTHPDYGTNKAGLAINDIMLIKLSRPAEFNQFTKPVCLPTSELNRYGEPGSAVFDNNQARVVGWGKTYEEKDDDIKIVSTAVQQMLTVPAVSNKDCVAQWRETLGFDLTGNIMPEQHLCAGGVIGKDSCKGDSGGPLMAREDDISVWQLVGVVSAGTKRCGVGAPAIFTRVSYYDQWIRDNMV